MDQSEVAHLNELAELRDRFVQLQSKDTHSPEELAELDALRNQVLQYQVCSTATRFPHVQTQPGSSWLAMQSTMVPCSLLGQFIPLHDALHHCTRCQAVPALPYLCHYAVVATDISLCDCRISKGHQSRTVSQKMKKRPTCASKLSSCRLLQPRHSCRIPIKQQQQLQARIDQLEVRSHVTCTQQLLRFNVGNMHVDMHS